MGKNKNATNRFSLLIMPDECESELFFWYGGNPFELQDKKSAIVASDGHIDQTEAVNEAALEIVEAMTRTSGSIGYLIAKKDFMVVALPTKRWNKLSSELLRFFPGDKSAVHRVRDDKKRIAGTENISKRINLVRGAEGRFATKGLPEVVFQMPLDYCTQVKEIAEPTKAAA